MNNKHKPTKIPTNTKMMRVGISKLSELWSSLLFRNIEAARMMKFNNKKGVDFALRSLRVFGILSSTAFLGRVPLWYLG